MPDAMYEVRVAALAAGWERIHVEDNSQYSQNKRRTEWWNRGSQILILRYRLMGSGWKDAAGNTPLKGFGIDSATVHSNADGGLHHQFKGAHKRRQVIDWLEAM